MLKLKSIILILFVSLLYSCQKDQITTVDSENEFTPQIEQFQDVGGLKVEFIEEPNIVYYDYYKSLDKNIYGPALLKITENEVIFKNINDSEIMSGDIISLEPIDGKLPYGFLRKVISVENINNRIVIKTENTSLDKAIKEGSFKVATSKEFGDFVNGKLDSHSKLNPNDSSQKNSDVCVENSDLNAFFQYERTKDLPNNLQAKINVAANLQMMFDYSKSSSGLISINTAIGLDFERDNLNPDIKVAISHVFDIKFATFYLPHLNLFTVGIPAWLFNTLDVGAEIETTIADATAGLDLHGCVMAGIGFSYYEDDWSSLNSYNWGSFDVGIDPILPDLSGNATIEFKFPYFTVTSKQYNLPFLPQAFATLRYNTTLQRNSSLNPNTTLTATEELEAGVKMELGVEEIKLSSVVSNPNAIWEIWSGNIFFNDPIGLVTGSRNVALKSKHHKYVSSNNGARVTADRGHANDWEKFEFEYNEDSGSYHIKGNNGKYLATWFSNKLSNFHYNEPDGYHTDYWIEPVGEGYYSIRTNQGYYIAAEPNGTFIGNRAAVGDWEKFRIEIY